jgi:glycerophosphoryl diester phosphodiesterase
VEGAAGRHRAPLLHRSALGVPIVPLRGARYQGVQLWTFVARHRRLLRWAHKQGWDAHMWPVNNPKAEAWFRSWGANVVITDDATALESSD